MPPSGCCVRLRGLPSHHRAPRPGARARRRRTDRSRDRRSARRGRDLFAGGRHPGHAPARRRAGGRTAAAAIELAKLAQRLPALLVGDGAAAAARLRSAAGRRWRPTRSRSSGEPSIESLDGGRRSDDSAQRRIPGPVRDLPRRHRRHADRRHRRQSGLRPAGPGAPALGVPDRRRVRLAALRLRRSASPCARRSSQQHGGGIILYLEQEGRGLGLANKIRTYQLQDAGLDTVDANTVLGFDDDERDYGVAVRMLQVLGCTRVRLLTNNPAKLDGLVASRHRRVRARAAARADQFRQPALSHRQGDARRTQARPPARRRRRGQRASAQVLSGRARRGAAMIGRIVARLRSLPIP